MLGEFNEDVQVILFKAKEEMINLEIPLPNDLSKLYEEVAR